MQGPTANKKDQSDILTKYFKKGTQERSTTAMQITTTDDKYVSILFSSPEI